MIAAVPPPSPVTSPDEEPIVISELGVVHIPDGSVLHSVTVPLIHTLVGPVIAGGVGFTVTVANAGQPAAVYDIVAVPAATPVTTPPITLAVVDKELLHAPPVVPSCSVTVLPWHTLSVPVMANGDANTVMVLFTVQPLPNE